MQIISTIRQASAAFGKEKQSGKRIGFVPTMGALHQGHASLIRKARKENDIVVVSIFVNPTQFAPGEDFSRYPRPLDNDLALCARFDVDYVFHPKARDMFPQGYKTQVYVKDLSSRLCGKSRPGHFQGVATVVAKLFNIIGPDTAYFGRKDAQQAVIIKRMSCDLNFPLMIKVMPIVRDRFGLALSSRNSYLSKPERSDAAVLYQSLRLARRLVQKGMKDTEKIIRSLASLIRTKKSARIEYISIVDPKTFDPVKRIQKQSLLAIAVRIGKTRLIDNVRLTP